MRAMVLRAPVDDLDKPFLTEEEWAVPTPQGPNDVVVDVAGAGVCRTDLEIVRGTTEVETPLVLGHENSGRVKAVGSEVSTVSIGDAVVCYPFQASGLSRSERRGLDNAAPDLLTPGINAPGGYADQLLVHERSVVPVPEGVDLIAAATLADAGLAAYRGCRKAIRDLAPDDPVAVIGIGGLGHLAIQILSALSANPVVAIDKRPEAGELAVELGSSRYATPTDPTLKELGPLGAVIDFVGSDETAALSLSLLGFGGRYVPVGVGGVINHPVLDVVQRELQIEGVFVGTYMDLVDLIGMFLDGSVQPRVVTYRLSEAQEALRDLESGQILGRAVLVP